MWLEEVPPPASCKGYVCPHSRDVFLQMNNTQAVDKHTEHRRVLGSTVEDSWLWARFWRHETAYSSFYQPPQCLRDHLSLSLCPNQAKYLFIPYFHTTSLSYANAIIFQEQFEVAVATLGNF